MNGRLVEWAPVIAVLDLGGHQLENFGEGKEKALREVKMRI